MQGKKIRVRLFSEMPGIQSLTGACNDNGSPVKSQGDHLALVSDLLSFCTLPAAKGNMLQKEET